MTLGYDSLSGFCEDCATAGRRLGASPGTLDQEIFQEELTLTTLSVLAALQPERFCTLRCSSDSGIVHLAHRMWMLAD